jgi:hypothetical protein
MTEMTRRPKKIISTIRRAIEENTTRDYDRALVTIQLLEKKVYRSRAKFESRFELCCKPSECISYRANTLYKVYRDKKEKYGKLAQETSNIRDMHMERIPVIAASLGAVHPRSLEALRNLLLCDDKEMKRIARHISKAAIMGSMKIWRRDARDMPRTEGGRAIRMTTHEIMIANDKQANERDLDPGTVPKNGQDDSGDQKSLSSHCEGTQRS